jgi:long-chain acyl-CoA synthetase
MSMKPSFGANAPRKSMPFESSYPKGIVWDAQLQPATMVELFDASVKKHARRTAVSFMGKSYTYREIDQMAEAFAGSLQRRGVRRGDRIGICMPNNPLYIVAYYGAMRAGATIVNFNPLYADDEMAHLVKDSGAKMMVTLNLPQIQPRLEKLLNTTPLESVISADFADLLPGTKAGMLRTINGTVDGAQKVFGRMAAGLGKWRDGKGIPALCKTSRGREVLSMKKMIDDAPYYQRPAVLPGQTAVLQYTGGTTGIPKAAELSHENLAANVRQTALWFSAGRDTNDAQRVLSILPFFHVFSMTVQMNLALHMGDELVLMQPAPKVDPKAILQTIQDQRVNIFAGVPDLYKKLNETMRQHNFDVSSLKTCVSGAAPLPSQTWDAWKANTGVEIVEGYGLSETSPLVAANPLQGQKKINSIGLPVPLTEVKIANLELPDQSVGVRVEGEICLRGPQIMKGYWNRPEETANVMDKDGYFHTGDVGYMDEDGYIFIVDRIKDMVIVNGFKAFPRHVEEAIMKHPAVAEVIVMGVKDEEKGEAVKAFIVLKPDHKVTAEELTSFLKDKLVHYEMPKARNIEFRSELPKTMIGKPDRKALKAEEKAKADKPAPKP